MRSGLFLPLFDELADPAVVARLSGEAEEAGWHGVFVWDNLRYQEPVVDVADPWISSQRWALPPRRIRLGPIVQSGPRRGGRSPGQLAEIVADLTALRREAGGDPRSPTTSSSRSRPATIRRPTPQQAPRGGSSSSHGTRHRSTKCAL